MQPFYGQFPCFPTLASDLPDISQGNFANDRIGIFTSQVPNSHLHALRAYCAHCLNAYKLFVWWNC